MSNQLGYIYVIKYPNKRGSNNGQTLSSHITGRLDVGVSRVGDVIRDPGFLSFSSVMPWSLNLSLEGHKMAAAILIIMTLGQRRGGFLLCVFSIGEDWVPSQLPALVTMLLVQDDSIYILGSRMEKEGEEEKKGWTAGLNGLLQAPWSFYPLFLLWFLWPELSYTATPSWKSAWYMSALLWASTYTAKNAIALKNRETW